MLKNLKKEPKKATPIARSSFLYRIKY